MTFPHDVIVAGGGPAGLSAALVLGRARRRTLVLDAGEPRNGPSPASHGVFTRDGAPPLFLRPPHSIRSPLPHALGCESSEAGFLRTGADHQTSGVAS